MGSSFLLRDWYGLGWMDGDIYEQNSIHATLSGLASCIPYIHFQYLSVTPAERIQRRIITKQK